MPAGRVQGQGQPELLGESLRGDAAPLVGALCDEGEDLPLRHHPDLISLVFVLGAVLRSVPREFAERPENWRWTASCSAAEKHMVRRDVMRPPLAWGRPEVVPGDHRRARRPEGRSSA